MSRAVDKAATKAARKAQREGIARLNDAFDVTPVRLTLAQGDKFTGRPRPVRLRPGVPPLRPDPDARARRRKRKAAHESRRRNRS